MRTIDTWLDIYAESHRNSTNKLIHYICVPIIFVTIIAMFFSIPFPTFNFLGIHIEKSMYINFATIIIIPCLYFWFRLSFKVGLAFLIFCTLVLITCSYILFVMLYNMYWQNLFFASLVLFILAWIGQFYGHKIEGKKPSFLDDLTFLLIGPIWIVFDIMGWHKSKN